MHNNETYAVCPVDENNVEFINLEKECKKIALYANVHVYGFFEMCRDEESYIKATAKTAPTSANIAFHIDYRTLIAKA